MLKVVSRIIWNVIVFSMASSGRAMLTAGVILGAAASTANEAPPRNWGEWSCSWLCEPADHAAHAVNSFFVLQAARKDGRTSLMTPLPAQGGPDVACAVMPDGRTRCCPRPMNIQVEHVTGKNPYLSASPKAAWRRVCRQ
jgi:hypothetical protein